jgi:voltage-gated potassium channel
MSDAQFGGGHKIGSFQIALLVFTVLLLCGLVLDTVLVLPKELANLVHMIDTFGCAVFFGDFCYRFYRAQSKLVFMRWGWIDLIACVPNLEILRWGRLVRVLRVVRLLRGVRSVQIVFAAVFQDKLRGGVVSVIFSAVLLVGFSSVSILVCERQAESNIKTAEDAVWWSIATITTVGYGDRYPVTTEGRVIGVILMVGGVSMFGCLSGLAASFFLGAQQAKTAEMKEVLARLDQLHAKLDALNGDSSDRKELERPRAE